MKRFLLTLAVVFSSFGFLPTHASARTDREACQMFLRSSKAQQLRFVKGVERHRLETLQACRKLIRLGRDWARPAPKPAPVPRYPNPSPEEPCTSSRACGHNRFCYHGRCVMEGAAYCSTNGECYGAEKCVNRVCK